MRSLRLPLIALFMSVTLSAGGAEPHSSLGTSFWWAPAALSDTYSLRLVNPSETRTASITFERADGSSSSLSLGPGESVRRVFDTEAHDFPAEGPVASTRHGATVHVRSDEPVSLHAGNGSVSLSSTDADVALLLPTPQLGTEYVLAAWYWERVAEPFIQVVATEADSGYELTDSFGHVIDAGRLGSFEARHLSFPSGTDVNGWRVTSDKPVAVFSGNLRANIGTRRVGFTCCADTVIEQIWPTTMLGRRYALAPFAHFPVGAAVPASDAFHIIAVEDDTEVVTFPDLGGGMLAAGELLRIVSNENFILEASKPVLVAQFMVSYDATEIAREPTSAAFGGDPSMSLVTPIERFGGGGLLAVTNSNEATARDFLDIVTLEGSRVELDGVPVTEPCIPMGSSGDESYCALHLLVQPGLHELQADEAMSVTVTSTIRQGSQIAPAWLAPPRQPSSASSSRSGRTIRVVPRRSRALASAGRERAQPARRH